MICRSPADGAESAGDIIQTIVRPETLFDHLFGKDTGFLVSFTGQQAALRCVDARPNELAQIRQRSWRYPEEAERASEYLINEAQLERDCYFSVHLFQEEGNRRADNTVPTVRALWLDEDEGHYPEEGPQPTAIVRSSRARRHLYWRLVHPVTVEWAVEMNRRLASWAAGDTGKAGLSSVLRAAGTANYKRPPAVDLVVGEFTGMSSWEPEVMDQAVPELPRGPVQGDPREPYDGPDVDLAPYLENVVVLGQVADSMGIKHAILCPWLNEHSGGDRTGTYVGQRTEGGLWFACHHLHCQGRGWQEFRREVRRRSPKRRQIRRPGYSGTALEVRIYRG